MTASNLSILDCTIFLSPFWKTITQTTWSFRAYWAKLRCLAELKYLFTSSCNIYISFIQLFPLVIRNILRFNINNCLRLIPMHLVSNILLPFYHYEISSCSGTPDRLSSCSFSWLFKASNRLICSTNLLIFLVNPYI
jgi:hypothetical protein